MIGERNRLELICLAGKGGLGRKQCRERWDLTLKELKAFRHGVLG